MATPADPRLISLTTPLGSDALYLTSFRGKEGLSQLFHFQLELMAENRTNIAFDKLIGQKVTFSILLPDQKTKRFWSGICSALSQDGRDSTFTQYRMEVVPQFWILTRRTQSRIFQNKTVPDILKLVLAGIDYKPEFQGTFEPRDYCVQYRESDFDFASRLMEEEGIYYYFKFTDGGHQMVVANSPQSHAATIFSDKATYEELEGGTRTDMRVSRWEKTQELRSSKVTLWDHCFELPHQHLDAERPTQEAVDIGKVSHKLKLPANDPLELYDYPGAYAQRFDGVDPGGGDNAGDLQKIFKDNKRTSSIRMEQEAVQAITIRGSSNCRQFMAGHKFTLEKHYNADGPYILTSVEHNASSATNFRSGGNAGEEVSYQNHFTCIPLALPFRPQQSTWKPTIPGPQTAVVVGTPGEKIFCDKYGRVKVQFHWDRNGKLDANSSCWVRVSQNWGGANWGGMFLPHVGHEVIVSFEEGDPDRPLITGRVYNAECMPPLELPANKTKSVIRDHGGNEIIMEGDAGKQQMRLFSPTHNTTVTLGNSYKLFTESDKKVEVQGNHDEQIGGNATTKIAGNVFDTFIGKHKVEVGGDLLQFFAGYTNRVFVGWISTVVGGFKTEVIGGYENKLIRGAQKTLIKGSKTEIISGTTYKIHSGEAREWRNTSEDQKTPEKRLSWKELKAIYGRAKHQVDGDYKLSIAAGLIEKADKVSAESKESEYKVSGMLRHKAATLQSEADTHLAKADDIIFKSSKFDCNGGKLVVK